MGQSIARLVGTDANATNDTNDQVQLKMGRHVLVTGGATVAFKELLLEVISINFLVSLKDHGFNYLHIQCGDYMDEMQKKVDEMGTVEGLELDIFDFNFDLKTQMEILCRGEAGDKPAGVVIGHAGTGTIADVLESEIALVIVANPNLMDNHQAKFAAEMAAEHDTVVQGQLGNLMEAIPKALHVIEENRLDDLEPLEEESSFPVDEGQRLKIFDQVIANGL